LSIAHALYDGWSLALLHRNVEAAYNGEKLHYPSEEPYLRKLQSTSSQGQDFWKQYLVDANPTLVATNGAPEAAADSSTPYRAESTSTTHAQRVSEFGKKYGISLQVIGQACWAAVLASLQSSLDLT